MPDEISRRFMIQALLAVTAMACPRESKSQDAALLDANDPGAKAFGFVPDASTVDARRQPTFREGQRCAVCSQYRGKLSDAAAGCGIFGGRVVPAGGWCKVWSQRPA